MPKIFKINEIFVTLTSVEVAKALKVFARKTFSTVQKFESS